MYRNVVTEMSPDRNGQTEMSRGRNGPNQNGSDRNGQTEKSCSGTEWGLIKTSLIFLNFGG